MGEGGINGGRETGRNEWVEGGHVRSREGRK